MFGTSWKIFSNTVLISDKLSSFFLKKNIAKKKNHSKFLKNAFVGENEIRKLKKSSFYAFFFVLPKNYGNESQPTKHKKIKYPHFSWKKKYCQMDLLNFLQHFSPRKIETFFSNKRNHGWKDSSCYCCVRTQFAGTHWGSRSSRLISYISCWKT